MGGSLARWLVALGSVAAAVGFTLVGIATSYVQTVESLLTLGIAMMIGGLVVMAVGLVANASFERAHGERPTGPAAAHAEDEPAGPVIPRRG
jgi:hypothetical protein